MKQIIKIKRVSSIGELKEEYTSYVLAPTKSMLSLTDDESQAHQFNNETEANDYIITATYEKNILSMDTIPVGKKEYHLKCNGTYVKESDNEYLVECTRKESVIDSELAETLNKQYYNITLEKI